MKKTLSTLILSTIVLSACSNAKTANEVNAAYVPSGKYERMSCRSLRAENREAERELADMTAAIEKSYRDDKTAEVVAWFLFAPKICFPAACSSFLWDNHVVWGTPFCKTAFAKTWNRIFGNPPGVSPKSENVQRTPHSCSRN